MSKDRVKRAGRGALFIAGAKFLFLLSGLGLTFLVPRLIVDGEGEQDPAQFGRYRVAAQTMTILAQTLLIGTLQLVSRFAAERRTSIGTLVAYLARRVLPLFIAVGLILQLLAPTVATSVLNDPQMTPLLRIAFLIPVIYGCYGLFMGAVNGSQSFGLQASLDSGFSVLKLSGILVLCWWFAQSTWPSGGARGALLGWMTAATCITLAAVLATKKLRRAGLGPLDHIQPGEMKRFALGIFSFTLAFELFKQVDLLSAKAMASSLGVGEAGQVLVGQYAAAVDFARVPYFIVLGISFVVFPMLSEAAFSGDDSRIHDYIRRAFRFTLGLATVSALGILIAGPGLLPKLFGPAYGSAAPVLQILAFGQVAFALFTMAMNVLNASGRPFTALCLVLVPAGIGALIVPRVFASGGLIAGAWAMITLLSLAALAALITVRKVLGATLSLAAFLRITGAAVCVGSIALFWQPSSVISCVASLAVVGLSDLLILILLRELNSEDYQLIKKVLGKA